MKLKTVLRGKTRSAGCFRKHPLLHLAAISMLAAQGIPNIARPRRSQLRRFRVFWARSSRLPAVRSMLPHLQASSTLRSPSPSRLTSRYHPI